MKNEINENPNKRAVIYCRVSTREQVDEGNSLVTQERLCREYCLKEEYDIAEVFIERGESAKTANRTELQRLLAFCGDKKNGVNAVVAYKVDRISRNIADYSYIKVRLGKNDITIKSVSEYFEDTPAGRFMENIIANVSQFDNEVRTERSAGGMKEAVQEGRYVWRAPLGYANVRIGNKSTIAPNRFSPLVREAFKLIASRNYPTEVVRLMMQEKGLTDKNGNAVTRSYFFRLVRNPLYKGVINMFGASFEGTYEPILSPALFDDVQAALKGRKNKVRHYIKENPDFPLRRFTVNENGKQLRGYWSQGKRLKYPYYSFALPGTTIRKEALEEKFMALLEGLAFDTSHFKLLRHYLDKHFGKHMANEAIAKKATEKRVMELNAQIDTLINLHAQGSISESILAGRVKKLEAELEELQGTIVTENELGFDIKELLRKVANILKCPHIFWENSSIDIKKKFQVFVFPNGVIWDGENLRTPKLSFVFQLKGLFEQPEFSRVNSRDSRKNTALRTNSQTNHINQPEFAHQLVQNLFKMQEIIKKNEA